MFFLHKFKISFFFIFSFDKEPAFAKTHAFLPPQGKVLLIIGQDKETIESYIQSMGQIPGGFMVYTSIQNLGGLDQPLDNGAGINHAQYLLERYPECVLQVGLYMVNALEDILRGKYDENITRLGEWIKRTERPIYLRIGYEFDYPQNHYKPEEYKLAFRYIVERLRSLGLKNVAFVWHSYAHIDPSQPIMSWYPGDQYVDWFALSFSDPYNKGHMQLIAKFAQEHNKPLMIAEASPSG